MSSVTSHHSHFMAPSQPTVNSNPPTPRSNAPRTQTTQKMLVDDGNLRAGQVLIKGLKNPERPETLANVLLLETGDKSDQIHISQRPDGQLYAQVNGRCYAFNTHDGETNVPTLLHIKTGAGNDRITIDPNVTVRVEIEAGDGDDFIQAGGGHTTIYGGRGNDHIRLGSGIAYAEGNEGDDTMMGGTGNAVMYGNRGRDRMYAGSGPASKHSHLDGGADDDQLYAGNGHTVLNGGLGNDLLVGHDDTTFYTGEGHDTVRANTIKARIYAQETDRLIGTQGATINHVTPTKAGRQAFRVMGPPDFIQRVEDDLELLRASPQGQKVLVALDKAALQNGGPVNIVPSDGPGNRYIFSSAELQRLEDTRQLGDEPDNPKHGYIKDGVPGARADKATILYDPSSYGTDDPTSPLVQLYHEMAHAWNGANGTFLPGSSKPTAKNPERPGPPNAELQAVGLPTNAAPFDFDNNPFTPPTSTNPAPFTENSLNEEMGKPLRQRYALHLKAG
ncbi:M91 family zinc metallopeptidase [Pseudomonas sp. 1152_12]|uniref:M91 family zinc metallopeptidase n=1 Tax=Pseudomonas sp. 1152_12 TaxID=2604455 RepID=UPI004064A093